MASRLTYTFDNGPWPGATNRLLDFLDERRIRASFFVVGERLADPAGRSLVARAAAEGHWIGNHTMTHGTPLGRDGGTERAEHEIGCAESLMAEFAHPRKFFRPNGGGSLGPHLLSPQALDHLTTNRYTVVTWNSVPRDWVEPHRDWLGRALEDLDRLDWPVLVLHDKFIADMLDTLDDFHERVLARGIEVVQDFAPACVPLERGEPRGNIGAVVGFPDSRTVRT